MSADTETRHCPKCGNDKPLSDFSQDRRRKDGFARWCKLCHRAAARRQKGSVPRPVEEYPENLEEAVLELALQELYARLHDPATVAEISTHTLAKIFCDLARIELAKGVSTDEAAVRRRKMDVLQMVNGLPPERQLEVLRAALPDAEAPEPIRRAIAELESRGDDS